MEHLKSVKRLAEIIIPAGINNRGRAATIATTYGRKTREGIADLIQNECSLAGLVAAMDDLLSSIENAKGWCDAHSADTSAAPDDDVIEKARKALEAARK